MFMAQETLDEIVDVAERTGLGAVAVDREVLAPQGLYDKVRYDAAVVGMHARAVGVEDPHDANIDLVFAVVVEEERLGATLALVVARPLADGIHVAPVTFRLRVHVRVTVHFARARLEHPRPDALGETEAVDRAHHRCLDRLDRVVLVVRRRRGTREVVDLLDLELEGVDDVVADEFKIWIRQQVRDVPLLAGEEIIEADDLVAVVQEPVAEVRAEKAGAAGDENAHAAENYGRPA
jgi:hypothetical protein